MTADDDVHYVRTTDGTHIACRARGEGPLDLLEIGGYGTLFPLDASDEQPRWRRFEERLTRFCRLIRFDGRGIGSSDPLTGPQRFEDWVGDALAVLDHYDSAEAAVMASSYASFVGIRLAALHPARVTALILANGGARFSHAEDYPVGIDAIAARGVVEAVEPGREEDTDIGSMAPTLVDDPDAVRWWARTARRGAGPATARTTWEASITDDVRDLVDMIEAPTAVIRTTGNRFIGTKHQLWLADNIPGARLIDIDAADHVIWAVPGDAVVIEIEEILTGRRSAASGTRRMVAVLFTDIVDSTRHNAAAGDGRWQDLLARHDHQAETEVRRRGGRLVKRLGDGVLAEFPLASDAIATGLALTRRADELGIGVRAAVHVAEVEQTADDVLGLGVTIAARALDHADGGQVVVTTSVADILAGSELTFTEHGTHRFKGVPGSWGLATVE